MVKHATLETRELLFNTLKEHKAQLGAFDNHGETLDRYTLCVKYPNKLVGITCSSEPGIIWEHFDCAEGMALEKAEIKVNELPEAVVQKLIGELNG